MQPQALHIEQQPGAQPGQLILRLAGPLRTNTVAKFHEVARSDSSRSLIIDLTNVPTVDSAGIGALVAAYVNRQNSDRTLALVGVNQRIRYSLKVAWVEQLFRFFDSVHEAEAASPA